MACWKWGIKVFFFSDASIPKVRLLLCPLPRRRSNRVQVASWQPSKEPSAHFSLITLLASPGSADCHAAPPTVGLYRRTSKQPKDNLGTETPPPSSSGGHFIKKFATSE
ncbi:hypothetical protein CDAR_424071 [Caerostris darwini]|uniref:Uncharacterized protein n=1 Tax=Caerostris darwini TaxID=1538125 RepID=A0AAV4T3R9_9ARAC|nr:hypothetical protein CDAR_424071 [Caerostris darwini]